MKETGLMFKAPLVRAIPSGQKTQTRRALNPQPAPNTPHDGGTAWTQQDGLHVPVGSVGHLTVKEKMGLRCPMGQPGDRIYVRETHSHHPHFPQIAFRADGEEFEDADGFLWLPKWTPAIHMKKKEARIWLEVTAVRVERLQDISEADASREGLQYSTERMGHWCGNGKDWQMTARQAFRDLWVSTGGDWAANPWVWVIDFKRIEKP